MNTKKDANTILADIDRRYVWLSMDLTTYSLPLRLAELQLHQSLQVYTDSTKAMASSSGLVVTQRCWWRYCTTINVSHPKLTFDILYRYTYLLSRVMFLMIWFMHYMHFSTSVTWHGNVLDTQSLAARQDALDRFHWYQEIFNMCGICSSFNLPRQHLLTHFIQIIQAFSTPNGLCSSITESKHIKAVKKPYWRSSHYKALGQMLLTNQCLDKLAAVSRGMECWMAHACCIHFGWSTSLVSLIYISICIILTNL